MNIFEEIDKANYHSLSEKLLKVIERKTNNNSSNYFRMIIAFYLSQVASNMRASVKGSTIGPIPVNAYVCALMPSGGGKGHSLHIMEKQIINKFRDTFLTVTLPIELENHLTEMARNKSAITGVPEEEILKALYKESNEYGPLPYSFDSGTGAAFKQVRSKAQLCNAGALTFICDEIGTNLINNGEITAMGLEVYDIGCIKPKITKNSKDNARTEDRDDPVPTNMLWFGTPSKLLNCGKEEDNFYDLLQQGYARRMLFGVGTADTVSKLTGKELRQLMLDVNADATIDSARLQLANLANIGKINKELILDEAEEELLLDYRLQCEAKAYELPSHEDIKQAELRHRYFKALKLAGAYAFVDGSDTVTREHLLNAMKLVEDSGKCLAKILKREKPYVKLAKYLGEMNKPMTQADIADELPFFKGGANVRQDMLNLASAWGYNNGIVIKSYVQGKIDFVHGEKLIETDLDKLIISLSNDYAYNYQNVRRKFSTLVKKLGSMQGEWTTHHLMEDTQHPEYGCHRAEKFVIPGFNLLVLDMDGGISIDSVKDIFKPYTYMLYTTKRHTEQNHRFRLILPMKYELYLSAQDYKQFMKNIYDSFPIDGMDDQTGQRSRKWSCNEGTTYHQITEELFDPRPYIPDTNQNQERIEKDKAVGNMDNITRWFVKNIAVGNRNNLIYRYGKLLKDRGLTEGEISYKVEDLNKSIENPLEPSEIQTILFSIAQN